MPAIGDMQVYSGAGWVRIPATTVVDVETMGWPPSMPNPMRWNPADHGEDPEAEPEDDPIWRELCEVLLCPNCDLELSTPACTAQHAYLADNPAEHRLLAPLLVGYLRQMRFDAGRLCGACSGVLERDVVLATGECPHVDVREDQVLMSAVQWQALADEIVGTRAALSGLEDRLTDYEEKLEEIVLIKKLKMETT